MPTPWELLLDPLTLASFVIYFGLLAWEKRAPARELPAVPGWGTRGLLSLIAYLMVASYLPFALGSSLSALQLLDATSWGAWGGAAIALLAYELLAYVYHRMVHTFDVLFYACHQMHHSAERLDVSGAFLFGPLDLVGFTIIFILALSLVTVTPEAAAVSGLAGFFLAGFQHLNVKTPRWIGYVIQRPESHAHHHARGVHRDNYSDLPLFDLMFGTFENPRDFAPEQGYYDGASGRVLEMLAMRNVTEPERGELRPSLSNLGS